VHPLAIHNELVLVVAAWRGVLHVGVVIAVGMVRMDEMHQMDERPMGCTPGRCCCCCCCQPTVVPATLRNSPWWQMHHHCKSSRGALYWGHRDGLNPSSERTTQVHLQAVVRGVYVLAALVGVVVSVGALVRWFPQRCEARCQDTPPAASAARAQPTRAATNSCRHSALACSDTAGRHRRRHRCASPLHCTANSSSDASNTRT